MRRGEERLTGDAASGVAVEDDLDDDEEDDFVPKGMMGVVQCFDDR